MRVLLVLEILVGSLIIWCSLCLDETVLSFRLQCLSMLKFPGTMFSDPWFSARYYIVFRWIVQGDYVKMNSFIFIHSFSHLKLDKKN